MSVALAHLAFGDRRAAYVLERWTKEGTPFSEMDDDVVNVALRDEWAAIEPRAAAGLALAAAKAVGETVADLPDAIAALATAQDVEWLMRRANHRREHIAQIETTLGV